MSTLLFLTGVSGSGKTTIIEALQKTEAFSKARYVGSPVRDYYRSQGITSFQELLTQPFQAQYAFQVAMFKYSLDYYAQHAKTFQPDQITIFDRSPVDFHAHVLHTASLFKTQPGVLNVRRGLVTQLDAFWQKLNHRHQVRHYLLSYPVPWKIDDGFRSTDESVQQAVFDWDRRYLLKHGLGSKRTGHVCVMHPLRSKGVQLLPEERAHQIVQDLNCFRF